MVWTLGLAVAMAAAPAAGEPLTGGAPNPQSLLRRARARQAVGEYEEAAGGYEAFVRLQPQASEAPEALQDAIVLRLALGQADAAAQDADLYVKSYGAKKSVQAAMVTFAVAQNAVHREDWAPAKKQLGAWLTAFGRSGPLDVRIRVHAALGRALVELGEPKKAEAEYAEARALWQPPAAAVRTIEAEGGDARRVGAALIAVGEAQFFLAEQKRHAVDAIRYPELKGKADKDAVREHLRTKVVDWVQKKKAAVEEAEREYLHVVELEPAPPPRWVIAAGSRVGQMWARFTAELRAAPLPTAWKGHGAVPGAGLTYEDLRRFYYAALDEASEPMRQRAKAAFSSCVSYSVKFEYADDDSRRCVEWLTKYDPAHFPRIDELPPRLGLLGPPLPAFAPAADPR
jgi:tetratricopeptide (TPR) repeat protein